MTTCVFAFVAQYFFVACASITAETGSILQTKSSFSVRADHDGLGASEQVTNDDTESVGNDDAAASSLSTAEGQAPSLAMVDLSQHWVHCQDGSMTDHCRWCAEGCATTTTTTTTAGVKWDVIVKASKLVNFDKDLQVMKGRAPSSATYVSDRVASVAPPLKVEGYYFFKLTFKGSCDKDTTMNCRRTVTMHWAQMSWLFESEPSGFHGIEITDSDGPVRWGKFNGLRSCGKLAVFCSATGWWAAVGQYQLHEDGIPAWPVNKFIADTVELQVRVP